MIFQARGAEQAGESELHVTVKHLGVDNVGRGVLLEGCRGTTRIEEVLLRACSALSVTAAGPRLRCGARLVSDSETLGEVASAEGAVDLVLCAEVESGGMQAAVGGGGEGGVPPVSEEEEDDAAVVRALFDQIDADADGSISVEEARAAATELAGHTTDQALCDALVKALNNYADSGQAMGWNEFRGAVRYLPRVRGQRLQWVRSLRLDLEVARLLKQGDFFDGLSGLKGMADEEAEQHVRVVCSQLCGRLQTLLTSRMKELRNGSSVTAKQFINTKFSMDGSFEGCFAKRQHFDDGPEKLIGTPNPNAEEGIRREHCERANARARYTSPNYNFEFFPKQEHEFVTSPDKRPGIYGHTPEDKQQWPPGNQWKGEHGRKATDLKEAMEHRLAKAVSLKKAEVISLRLYTGPMYMLYNAVLRKFPKAVLESLLGNRYESTIFCIISGISKLSKATYIPPDRRVFRGLGGMLLPDEFWSVQEGGFRGGIEWGLMSTTTNREVAVQYSGMDKQRGVVFEIAVGRVDIGANLSWVSQYPGEEEYLFPPLTFLEVVGEPRVEGEIVVFPLRANINLKCLTLEQLEERRKGLHLATARNLVEELTVAATNRLSDCDKERPWEFGPFFIILHFIAIP